jgi:hypothetical protein
VVWVADGLAPEALSPASRADHVVLLAGAGPDRRVADRPVRPVANVDLVAAVAAVDAVNNSFRVSRGSEVASAAMRQRLGCRLKVTG